MIVKKKVAKQSQREPKVRHQKVSIAVKQSATEKRASNVLLPYQIKWLADEARVKVAEKSRRVGITWAEAADSALKAAAQKGMDTWYLGYNRDMALEFIEEVAVDDEKRNIQSYRIRFESGHKIVALSSRPSNLRGKQGRAVIDEAAFHDDLPGLLKAALAFTMWGGAVRIISTHNGANSPFNELVNDIRAGRKPYSLHRITLDDAIADGLYHRICTKLGRKWGSAAELDWRQQLFEEYGDDAAEELLCIPRAGGGAFLSSVLIEARMVPGVPVVRWEMPDSFASSPEWERTRAASDFCEAQLATLAAALDPAAVSAFGEDFGRSGDLSVIWPLQIRRDLQRHTPFIVELRNIPFQQQEQILFYIVDRLPRLAAGALDARGNGQYLAERAMQRYGSRIQQVMLSNEWYRENMPRYKAAFEDGKIAIPLDAEILADHRSLIMEDGVVHVPERRVRNGSGQRHGDSAIAGALAFFASQINAPEISYTAAAPSRSEAHTSRNQLTADDDGGGVSRARGRMSSVAGAW
jgi:phage FluMu gp28-like protein